MSDDNKPPPVVEIDPKVMSDLEAAVGNYYTLMKQGKSPGRSTDAAAALKKVTDVVADNLVYDHAAGTWVKK